jgi:HEAT repeat protein
LIAQQKRLLKLLAPSETAAVLVQGLVYLHKAVKGAAFYPQGHPSRTEALQRAFELLREILAQQEILLVVGRQGFLLEGEVIEGGVMVRQLAQDCFVRRIASIALLQDLQLKDLESFVELLSGDLRKTAALGGFAKLLEKSASRTVWVNEKDLAAIWAKRGGGGPGAGAADGGATAGGVATAGEPVEGALGGHAAPSEGADGEGMDGFAALQLASASQTPAPGVTELLRLMELEREDARYQALTRALLDRIGGDPVKPSIVPVLSALLMQHRDQQRSEPQRSCALSALEQLAERSAELLVELLESRDCADREAIHRILAALGEKGAHWLIQRICLSEGLFERKALAQALEGLGARALPQLVAMLKDERWYVVRNMVAIIGELRLPEAVAPLKRVLYHEDLRVRKETIRAIMKIGGEPAESALIPLLEEQAEGLARQTILSLGLLQSRQAVPALLKLLDRRDLLLKRLREKLELLAALGRIGDLRATAPLLKLLGSRGWTVLGRRLELKIAVASALGVLGDQAALAPLAALAAGNGDLARACREALSTLERSCGGAH